MRGLSSTTGPLLGAAAAVGLRDALLCVLSFLLLLFEDVLPAEDGEVEEDEVRESAGRVVGDLVVQIACC